MQINNLELEPCLLLCITFTAELHSEQRSVTPAPKHLISPLIAYCMAHDSMANLQLTLQVEHQEIRCLQQT